MADFYISLHGTEVYPAHLKGSQVTKGVAKGKFEILIPPQKTQKMGLAWDGSSSRRHGLKMQDLHRVFEVEVYVL